MDMNVEAGTSGEREKKKRGRKPKANPQVHRWCFRMNNADRKRLLAMYKRSGMKSYSAFIADRVLNCKPKIIEIDKLAIDYVILLSSFFAQFRAIANNFNQAYRSLVEHFGEEKTVDMIQIVVDSIREFGQLRNKIIETTLKLTHIATNLSSRVNNY